MKLLPSFAVLASSLVFLAGQASATTLTFEDLAEGAVLSNQYAALGVVFSANPLNGAGISTSGLGRRRATGRRP